MHERNGIIWHKRMYDIINSLCILLRDIHWIFVWLTLYWGRNLQVSKGKKTDSK